jgi:hypothetical protein
MTKFSLAYYVRKQGNISFTLKVIYQGDPRWQIAEGSRNPELP